MFSNVASLPEAAEDGLWSCSWCLGGLGSTCVQGVAVMATPATQLEDFINRHSYGFSSLFAGGFMSFYLPLRGHPRCCDNAGPTFIGSLQLLQNDHLLMRRIDMMAQAILLVTVSG